MEKSSILDKIVDFYTRGNYRQFAEMIGVKYSTVTAWKYRNSFDVDIISAKCKEINYQFILTGEEPMLKHGHSNDSADKITIATNELLLACSELKRQIADIRQELQEERRQHQATIALFNRILDIYKHNGASYIQQAEDQYQMLAAEAEIEHNKHEAV